MSSSESFGAQTLTTETSGSRIQEELCSYARAATAARCSTKPFTLEAQQSLWRAERAAGWEPWLCLASCAQVGLSQGKAQPMCLSWHCLSVSVTSDLAVQAVCWNTGVPLCPSRPCLGTRVVTSHRGLPSVWGLNVWGFQGSVL